MTLDKQTLFLLQEAANILDQGFGTLPDYDPQPDQEALRDILNLVAQKMQNNYPYQHPFYAGQMLKPPHSVARLAYALAMFINPNNHALDGSRASSPMEKEAVAAIAAMFGWQTYLGHLTSGGTVANLEGLWVAHQLNPGKMIVASAQAHYTHSRLCGVLGIPFQTVAIDARARMDIDALEDLLKTGDVGTVVVTMGTTATGSIDPLPEVLVLRERYDFRIHADSAYGGYFTLSDQLGTEARAAFDMLKEVDSIAIDPHKHGLQPYGCGCILFKDPSVGQLYKHDSPYTYFTSGDLHLGEITLECSRAGASAVALWATQKLLPLIKDGQFAGDLGKCLQAGTKLYNYLNQDPRFVVPFKPQLDIVVWAVQGETASVTSQRAQAVFDAAAERDLHLALARLPKTLFPDAPIEWDQDSITCLRSCLIKPDHLGWLDRIWAVLDEATEAAL